MENTVRPHVSERCATCPTLQKCEQFIAVSQERIDETTMSYRHGLQETFADAIIKASELTPELQDEVFDREELISEFIQGQSELLTRLEERIGATRLHMGMLQLGCSGLVRLRALHEGTEYTVEVCGSPQKENHGKYEDEGVRVKRRFLD